MADEVTVDMAVESYGNGDYLLCQLQLMAMICQQLKRIADAQNAPPVNPTP